MGKVRVEPGSFVRIRFIQYRREYTCGASTCVPYVAEGYTTVTAISEDGVCTLSYLKALYGYATPPEHALISQCTVVKKPRKRKG